MSGASTQVEVTQADRDAAAEYGRHRLYSGLGADGIIAGRADRDDLVQAFARHRIAAEAAARPVVEREAIDCLKIVIEKVIRQRKGTDDWFDLVEIEALCKSAIASLTQSPEPIQWMLAQDMEEGGEG